MSLSRGVRHAERILRSRLILGVVFLGVASPVLWAQQAATAPLSDAARNQVEGFERSLLGAIDSAAGKLNERVVGLSRRGYPARLCDAADRHGCSATRIRRHLSCVDPRDGGC